MSFSDEAATTMRQKLGLPESADEATILAALDEALTERAEPAAASTPQIPEGTVLVDQAIWDQTQKNAAAGAGAAKTLAVQERDRVINQALKDGKIAATSRDKFVEAWDKDAAATRAILDSLTPGVVPTSEVGHESEPAVLGADIEVSEAELNAFGASLGLNAADLKGASA